MGLLILDPPILVISVFLIVMKNSVMVSLLFLWIPVFRTILLRILLVSVMAPFPMIPISFIPRSISLLFLLLSFAVVISFLFERKVFHVKQFLKILKCIPAVLARIAHVIEHIFCNDVPHITFDDEEDL